MVDYDRVPWPEVQDYLLNLGAARTKEELLDRAVEGLDRLIPADIGAGLLDPGGRFVSGYGLSAAENRAYNEYYRLRIPVIDDQRRFQELSWQIVQPIEWRDFRDSEFVSDFARPAGIARSLILPGPSVRLAISVHRSTFGAFSEAETATIAVINPHLSNLYTCLEKLSQPVRSLPSAEEVRERFPALSRREAQIASSLCRDLTAAEMASRLFISRRTVETHVLHIYQKLDVRTKRKAVDVLLSSATPDPGYRAS